jgi:hypothetical protein
LDLTNGRLSTVLTRVTYSTFDPTVPNQWAQGANGALAFSNNLIGAFVTIELPWTDANSVYIAETIANRFRLTIVGITIDRHVYRMRVAEVKTDFATNSEIDFNKPDISVQFRQVYSPAACSLIDLAFSPAKRVCAAA